MPARSPIDVRIRIKRVSSDRSGVHGVPNLLNQDLSRALRGLFNAYHKLRFINVVNTRDYKTPIVVSLSKLRVDLQSLL